MVGKCGALWPASAGSTFSIRTRRSYQAACPVIGSELATLSPSLGGSNSLIRWFSKNPLVNSGESAARFQAPARLPIAFQVHTVSGLTRHVAEVHGRADQSRPR